MKITLNLLAILSLLFLFACNSSDEETLPNKKDTSGYEEMEPGNDTKQHSNEFMKTRLHGKYFIKAQGFCANCHGKDFNGTRKGPSCKTCHSVFPHSKDFVQSGEHGYEVVKNGDKSCKACHDNPKADPGVPSLEKCQKCHQTYPHTQDDWSEGEVHGTFVSGADEKADTTSSCMKCHGEDSYIKANLPEAFVSCNDCHEGYPHSKIFKKGEHARVVLSDKDAVQSCLTCHGEKDYQSGVKSCQDCHLGYPHLDENWGEQTVHGASYMSGKDKQDKATCVNCHDGDTWRDRNMNAGSYSCTDCHELFPVEHDSIRFIFGGHSGFVDRNVESIQATCTGCHREYKANMPTPKISGGSCTTKCHKPDGYNRLPKLPTSN